MLSIAERTIHVEEESDVFCLLQGYRTRNKEQQLQRGRCGLMSGKNTPQQLDLSRSRMDGCLNKFYLLGSLQAELDDYLSGNTRHWMGTNGDTQIPHSHCSC